MTILHNKIQCNKCKDIIESYSVHDFKFCSCGEVFVDGGQEYLRRGGIGLENLGFEELTEYLQWNTPGALLFTKDGRRFGNAIVLGSKGNAGGEKIIKIETDFGNKKLLFLTELNNNFFEPTIFCPVDQWYNNRMEKVCHKKQN